MYTQHFFKMLFGLVLMAVIGLGFLVFVNQSSHRDPLSGIVPATTAQGNSSTTANVK